MKGTAALTCLALAGAALFAPSAFAASATVTGTITAGSLSMATSATPSFSVTLDGTDKTPTYTVPTTVTDTTGSGAGWNLTITSTQFTTGGGTPKTLATNASTITGVTNSCTGSGTCTSPTNGIGYPIGVPAASSPPAAVKYFNAAASSGAGEFTNTPTVQVAVPASSAAGSYTSTLTLAAVSGP
jgi:WxL domain surface cell wall-binding